MRRKEPALENLARRLGVYDQVDLSSRPDVSISLREGSAVLRTPDKRRLFDYLRVAVGRDRPLEAWSVAPVEDVRRFDGRVFFYEAETYRLRCGAWARGGPVEAPYSRRLVRIESAPIAIQLDRETGGTEVVEGPTEDADHLFLDAIPLSLDDETAQGLFSSLESGAYAEMGEACFAPPVRAGDHDEVAGSYFSAERQAFRRAIRATSGLDGPRPDEPAATLLQRLTDDPLLRDVLLDGGALRVLGVEGEPTRVQLEVRSDTGPAAAIRGGMLLEGRIPGPRWAADVARALRDDVECLLPGGLRVLASPEPRPFGWTVEEHASDNPRATEGTWHVLARELRPRLEDGHAREADFLREEVLVPSWYQHDDKFDHSLAERLFTAHGWRCPWPATDGQRGAWRVAALDLLGDEMRGERVSPDERVASWSRPGEGDARRAPRITFDLSPRPRARGLQLRYSGDPEDDEVLRWRLLLPLGTTVNARTLYLDRGARSQLDRGLVLG